MANIDIVNLFYREHSAGNIDASLQVIGDDVEFLWVATPADTQHAGRFSGKAAFKQQMELLHQLHEYHSFRPIDVIEQGDRVSIRAEADITRRSNGVRFTVPTADFFKVRDGKIVEVIEYYDTAHVLRSSAAMSPTPEQVVRQFYKDFKAGDVDAAGAPCADDMTFLWVAAPQDTDFAGKFEGKAAFLGQLRFLHDSFVYNSFEPIDVVTTGDRVAVRTRIHLTPHGQKEGFTVLAADFWTVRDGKIVDIVEYYDTALVARMMGSPAATGSSK